MSTHPKIFPASAALSKTTESHKHDVPTTKAKYEEAMIAGLGSGLEASFRISPAQDISIKLAAKLLRADFPTPEEVIIDLLADIALLLYRLKRISAYGHLIDARNALISEADTESQCLDDRQMNPVEPVRGFQKRSERKIAR